MRKVELVPGVHSSILGFGCAPILGAVGAQVATRALDCALEHGVTHLDIARSYGYGEAEAFLGRYLMGRRDQVVLASKFGIRATWKAKLLRPLKPLARAVKKRRGNTCVTSSPTPPVTEVPTPCPRKDPFHERVPITPESMMDSLHQSLRALRTDYLDILFVHEPVGAIERFDELAAAAAQLKDEGKIRGWGLAFDWSARELLAPTFEHFDVLQCNNSPDADHYADLLTLREKAPNVFFSPFRTSRGMSPDAVLRKLWADFPASTVLCSMFNPEHIKKNALAADGG